MSIGSSLRSSVESLARNHGQSTLLLSTRSFNDEQLTPKDLSPELIPIVTLLASQSHRRYHEGFLMLYYDLNGDGKPADRQWREVYGILTGNQLAYWDAANLTQSKNNPEVLLGNASKPNYLNFTDAEFSAMKSLPALQHSLENVIVTSTTLKNRYILQFKTFSELADWCTALRLSCFEYEQLQEAYTGALLLARGSRLSDIRTILAEKRFAHEDWVSIRYGSGMPWKRCFAVVEPSHTKRKCFEPGKILLFDSDSRKKKQLLATINQASLVTAIYPQSHQLIDHSTLLKIDAFINFTSSSNHKKKDSLEYSPTTVFLMPEQHVAVPGFDTLIRFLVPMLDSFGLYGRPQRLNADRIDVDSLLFGLPTLPHVHYLETSDVQQLVAKNPGFLSWNAKAWRSRIKEVLSSKLSNGYEGCGSLRGILGSTSSISTPRISQSPLLPIVNTPPNVQAFREEQECKISQAQLPMYREGSELLLNVSSLPRSSDAVDGGQMPLNNVKPVSEKTNLRRLLQLAEIYSSYSNIHNSSGAEDIQGQGPTLASNIQRAENVYPLEQEEFPLKLSQKQPASHLYSGGQYSRNIQRAPYAIGNVNEPQIPRYSLPEEPEAIYTFQPARNISQTSPGNNNSTLAMQNYQDHHIKNGARGIGPGPRNHPRYANIPSALQTSYLPHQIRVPHMNTHGEKSLPLNATKCLSAPNTRRHQPPPQLQVGSGMQPRHQTQPPSQIHPGNGTQPRQYPPVPYHRQNTRTGGTIVPMMQNASLNPPEKIHTFPVNTNFIPVAGPMIHLSSAPAPTVIRYGQRTDYNIREAYTGGIRLNQGPYGPAHAILGARPQAQDLDYGISQRDHFQFNHGPPRNKNMSQRLDTENPRSERISDPNRRY